MNVRPLRTFLAFLTILALWAAATPANAAIVISVADGAGEGFNDPALGADRLASMQAAADIWAEALKGTIDVVVEVEFNSLGGTGLSATLGRAGPTKLVNQITGGVDPDTFYPYALADQLEDDDIGVQFSDTSDIEAEFNTDVDGTTVLGATTFAYRTSFADPLPPNTVDFLSTALHELGHGLGFTSLVNIATGALPNVAIFDRQIGSALSGAALPDMASDPARLTAITSGVDLVWLAGAVDAERGGPTTPTLMYAPDPVESGSSVSHWDISTTPNELMEPFATGDITDIGLTKQAFSDIGWGIVNFDSRLASTGASTLIFGGGDFTDHPVAIDFSANDAAGNVNVELILGDPPGLAAQGPDLTVLDDSLDVKGLAARTFSATLTFGYTDARLTAAGVTDESLLGLYKSDDGGATWSEVPSTVDSAANEVESAEVTGFSLWAIAASPSTAAADDWKLYE